MNLGMDNDKLEPGTAVHSADRAGARSRIVRRILTAALIAVAIGPAIAAFVFVVAMPAVRTVRQSMTTSAPPAERLAGQPGRSRVMTRDESPRLLAFDEAFWKSRLALAKEEPISLTVDLVDSTATLDIRGVPVRDCKIHRIEISRAIKLLEATSDLRDRLSKPLVIQREMATLPKEPIRVEIAPKDTIEANLAAARPLAPEHVDVYFTLWFDADLAIEVTQLEGPTTPHGLRKKIMMEMRDNLDQAKNAVRSLIHSELPEQELRIEVTLAREDAKAIYRALGSKSRVALRL
jgi:hypothetical protein